MAQAPAPSVTLLVASLIRLQYKHVFEGCLVVCLVSTAVTAAFPRSSLLREAWRLVADSQAAPVVAADERVVLQRVADTLDVCARGLAGLLAESSPDRERCRRGALECAASVLRAFASAALADDSPASASRLLRTVDDRLVSHENSVLSGEKTYALDLDALSNIPASAAGTLSDLDGDGSSAAAWERLAETAVVLLLVAVRAVANIDRAVGPTPSSSVPARVLNELQLIVDELDRGARGLPETPEGESDRVGKLLSEVLRTGLPKHVLDDLSEAEPSSSQLREALAVVWLVWLDIGARELEIVGLLDRELPSPSYAQFASLRQAIVAGAANILAGGRLLERPEEFLLINALVHQHDGLAHAVEFYTAGLRGHAPARTQAQLVVATRLLRTVAALWLIDARLHRSTAGASAPALSKFLRILVDSEVLVHAAHARCA